MNRDLDDDLSDLLGGAAAPRQTVTPPASYVTPEVRFTEGCPKCRGTGRFISYAGRDCGPCFACKGAGERTFKTSSEDRARNRENAAERRREARNNWHKEHQDILDWFVRVIDNRPDNPFRFAVSLREGLAKYGTLTAAQVDAARSCIAKDLARAAARKIEREAAAPAADVSALERAFQVAREKAERPGQMGTFVKPLRLTHDGLTVAVRPGSIGSQWEGQLFVKSGDRKLGYFKGGKFFRQGNCSDAEQASVLACAAAPFDAVKAYAKAWSRCGICNRELLNDVSIEIGIGPICREKYGW